MTAIEPRLAAHTSDVETLPIKRINEALKAYPASQWRQAWSEAAELGLFRGFLPVKYGGAGQTAAEFVDIMMQLGDRVADNGLTMGLNAHVWTVQHVLATFGSESQCAAYLPAITSGRMLGAFALTETGAGSDAMKMAAHARKHAGGYVINGAKALIGMGPVCDIAIVFATTAPERGNWGISAFLVEAGDIGFIRANPQEKMGLTTLPIGALMFEDCWVPEDRLIGPAGAGAQIIQATLDWERCFILAPHVGAMARQLRDCMRFAERRDVFGSPVIAFQSVSNRLADMRLRLETCRAMLARGAALYDTEQPLSQFASMANLHVSEAFLASSMDALRNFGGAGYLDGAQAGTDVTDALGGVIYSGTSDIQRQIVVKLEQQAMRQAQRRERKE
ncbi:MAG: acyl-CoA dehydrogenase family protein [Pseudomonadota bacterium]